MSPPPKAIVSDKTQPPVDHLAALQGTYLASRKPCTESAAVIRSDLSAAATYVINAGVFTQTTQVTGCEVQNPSQMTSPTASSFQITAQVDIYTDIAPQNSCSYIRQTGGVPRLLRDRETVTYQLADDILRLTILSSCVTLVKQ